MRVPDEPAGRILEFGDVLSRDQAGDGAQEIADVEPGVVEADGGDDAIAVEIGGHDVGAEHRHDCLAGGQRLVGVDLLALDVGEPPPVERGPAGPGLFGRITAEHTGDPVGLVDARHGTPVAVEEALGGIAVVVEADLFVVPVRHVGSGVGLRPRDAAVGAHREQGEAG